MVHVYTVSLDSPLNFDSAINKCKFRAKLKITVNKGKHKNKRQYFLRKFFYRSITAKYFCV